MCRRTVQLSAKCVCFCQRHVTSTRPSHDFVSSPPGSLAVDLYPLALHVSLCDAAGRPSGRERLVLTSHHVHVRDMLINLSDSSRLHGLGRGLSVTAMPTTQEVKIVFSTSTYICGKIPHNTE